MLPGMLRPLILILLATTMVAADLPVHVATTPVERPDAEARERHAETLKDPARATAKLVFLGDSITEMWRNDEAGKPVWNQHWAKLGALNLGVPGDRTEHVLWRIDHGALDGLKPKLVVLMIGTNNAGHAHEPGGYRCTARETADGIRAILLRIRAKCPAARILLMGILPRTENEDPANVQNLATNAIIKDFADGKTLVYLDIGRRFVNPANGDANLGLMPDLLHINTDGYRIWAEAIAPIVAEALE